MSCKVAEADAEARVTITVVVQCARRRRDFEFINYIFRSLAIMRELTSVYDSCLYSVYSIESPLRDVSIPREDTLMTPVNIQS